MPAAAESVRVCQSNGKVVRMNGCGTNDRSKTWHVNKPAEVYRLKHRCASQRTKRGLLTASHEDLVGAVLIAQLGSVALARLELDGDLLLVEQVGALEDDAKGALSNLLADAIMHAHDV